MTNRSAISFLICGMAQAVLFGIGMIVVLVTPLAGYLAYSIPVVVVGSALLAALVFEIADRKRRLRGRRCTDEKCRTPGRRSLDIALVAVLFGVLIAVVFRRHRYARRSLS